MIINKDYIEYNIKLVSTGFVNLNLKALNKLANTGVDDINLKEDIISLRHYSIVLDEFSKMYGECFSNVSNIVYQYLTVIYNNGSGLEEVYLQDSSGEFLITSESDYNEYINEYIFTESDYSTLKYITKKAQYEDYFKYLNYNSNGFISSNIGQLYREYLQDKILTILECLEKPLLLSFSDAIKNSIEILTKYNALTKPGVSVSRTYYTTTFRILNGLGGPISNAIIKINNMSIILITNSDGYASTTLTNGDYTYTVQVAGQDDKTGSIQVSNSSVNTDLEFPITWILSNEVWNDTGVWDNDSLWDSAQYIATITILDENSIGLEGALVSIDGNSLTTNSSGQVSVYLVDGNYEYDVSALGYVTSESNIEVDGIAASSSIQLALQPYEIEFTILDSQNNPVEGATITIDE